MIYILDLLYFHSVDVIFYPIHVISVRDTPCIVVLLYLYITN